MRTRHCRKQFDAYVHLPPNILMRKRNAAEQFDVTHLRSGVGLSRSLRYSTRSFGTAPFLNNTKGIKIRKDANSEDKVTVTVWQTGNLFLH
jgi:hypothetical protein